MQKYSQFVNTDKFVVYKQAVQVSTNWSGDSLQTVRTVAYRMGEGVKNGCYVVCEKVMVQGAEIYFAIS